MKNMALALVALALLSGDPPKAARRPDEEELRTFMQQKLGHSQKVLEGVVLGKFDAIDTGAQAMSVLSVDASWQVLQTFGYQQRSAEFRRTADTLSRMAKAKNLDGAALAYVQLTLNCVDCHKYIRGVKAETKKRG